MLHRARIEQHSRTKGGARPAREKLPRPERGFFEMTRVIELFFYFVDFFPRPSIFHLIIVIFPRSFPPQFTFVSNPGRCQQSAISNEILNPTPSSFPSFYVPNRLSKVSTYPSLRPPAHPTSIMASFHILDKDSWSKILPFCDAKGALSLTQVVSSEKIPFPTPRFRSSHQVPTIFHFQKKSVWVESLSI